MSDHDHDQDALRVRAELLRHRVGALLSDGEPRPVRFVDDPGTGELIVPLTEELLEAMEHVLFVPAESDDALQILLAPDLEHAAPEALIDRWRIHHGDMPSAQVRWTRCAIESARFGPIIADGETLMRANPLAGEETRICARLNDDRGSLERMCARATGMEITAPLCVGVDPDGLHVRHKLGVLRVPFAHKAADAAGAEAQIDALYGRGEGT